MPSRLFSFVKINSYLFENKSQLICSPIVVLELPHCGMMVDMLVFWKVSYAYTIYNIYSISYKVYTIYIMVGLAIVKLFFKKIHLHILHKLMCFFFANSAISCPIQLLCRKNPDGYILQTKATGDPLVLQNIFQFSKKNR